MRRLLATALHSRRSPGAASRAWQQSLEQAKTLTEGSPLSGRQRSLYRQLVDKIIRENPNTASPGAASISSTGSPMWRADLFKEALKIKPDDAGACSGMALIQAEEFGGNAAKLAAQGAEIRSAAGGSAGAAGAARARRQQRTRARDEAHKALEMDPNSVQAQSHSGHHGLAGGQEGKPWDPHDARGYETAAHFFMLNRRYPESIEYYRKAIALDPAAVHRALARWRSI